ncbi:BglG family transcription antiterminator [Anaerosinus massiliensis]|uniref:BglG family transcription antiterminator n=1 Tax=Massilibacillus massiliensis TaxID=1806837 RepID=UPI000DA6195F|nr:BglG family transcription antiterminator [Massilibacillus massiliensis]
MNARRQELLKLLETSFSGAALTVEKIAQVLGVSNRTVRYDLDAIGGELRKKGQVLCKKAQKGIWIESMFEKQATEQTACWSEYYEYVLSKEERCNAIIVNILNDDTYISTEQLAGKLSISRSTLLTDLKSVKKLLEQYKLNLCTKRGLGLWVEGTEEASRNILIHIFSGCLHDFGATKVCSDDSSYEIILFREYAKELPVKEIAKFFIGLVNEYKLPCYDFSINHMVLALIVQLKRLNMNKKILQLENQQSDHYQWDLLAHLSKKMVEAFASYNQSFRDHLEGMFITRKLLSSKIYIFSDEKNMTLEHPSVNLLALSIAKTFVEHCQVWLGDIYLDDEELMYNLALHLQPAVERAKYGMELINPLLPQIREQYGNLFMIALRAVGEIEQSLGIKMSDDEIGYLTIHLGGAIERKKIRTSKSLQVLLVCGNGVGTANLLAITLKNKMSYLNIKKIISVYEIKEEELDDIDIVISTIALKLDHVAVLHVSPILSDAEITVIENQIQYFYDKKFAKVEKVNTPKNSTLSLKEVLLPETIALDVEADNWEEAIKSAGNLLVDTKAVEKKYVDSMIQCVKDMGVYIVIGPGLAMPHARCEDGVNKICLSMVRLVNPVKFGSPVNDPVNLVFAFGAVDSKSHLRVLYELWQIFNDPAAMEVLRTCKNKVEVLSLIKNFESKEENAEFKSL